MVNFTGSGVALITPFTKNNKINYDKIDELIEKEKLDLVLKLGIDEYRFHCGMWYYWRVFYSI